MSDGLLSTIALLYSVYFVTANKVQLRTEADWGVAIHSSVGLKGMDVMDGTKGKNKSKNIPATPDDGKPQEEEDKYVECFNYNNILLAPTGHVRGHVIFIF